MKLSPVCFLLVVLALALGHSTAGLPLKKKEDAYVTLLYGDEFLLGVRVLGKSIRDTGSRKDMVALVSDGVSDYAKKLLEADGWMVETISLLANPNQVRPTRFWGVYTKLKIFNMTNYRKVQTVCAVVYLDADTIVVKNIEDLFKCSKFCANLKHSERLNSGVMVVEPSEVVFSDMMTKVNTMYSYTGGDQGFLNSYFPDFPNAHLFQPGLSKEELDSRPTPNMERLSTLYNADVGLYMLANKWMVDESELRVIHYTLGPLKPWDWWTSWLLKPVDVWQNVRVKLEETLPGTKGGKNPHDQLLVNFLFVLPLFALALCYYQSFSQARMLCRGSVFDHIRHLYYRIRSNGALAYNGVSSSSPINFTQQCKWPAYLVGLSVGACFMAALMSLGISVAIVPHQVMPWTGLLLMYEWTFTLFLVLFGGFLHLIYLWGRTAAMQAAPHSSDSESSYDSGKGHQRSASSYDLGVWFYWAGMAFLAIGVPSLPHIFGVTALFARLGLIVAGGMILASFMTYAAEHLSIRSYLKGFEDRDITRGRSLC
ncbi:unnamed protein product [Linum tenue]|uniref:Hexosyltransferase n=1 Tax=Linum tenue TaxID=586396 RepID=A0AAV0LJS9_9ROSI|nr:unnamed protein product [Linum tenue]